MIIRFFIDPVYSYIKIYEYKKSCIKTFKNISLSNYPKFHSSHIETKPDF